MPTTALSTVKTFNDLARRAAAKGSETLSLIWKAGETAKIAKERLPHGDWMEFVETHYDVNHKTVTRWMQFHNSVPESKLGTVPNLTAGIKMLEPPSEAKSEKKRATSSSETGEPGGATPASTGNIPVASGPASGATAAAEPDEPDPFEPELAPDDKCPNCAGTKWKQHEDGVWTCAKCVHTHGEPAGDVDDERVATQRAKTVKTVESLMRAFDDLHHICPKSFHGDAIDCCKELLETARGWK